MGAGSFVREDILDNCVAHGNPCRGTIIMNLKIKTCDTILIFIVLMTIRIPYFSQRTNNIIALCLETFVFLLLLSQKGIFRVYRNNINILVFWVITMLCTFINHKISTRFLNSVVTGFGYVLFFVSLNYLCRTITWQRVVNTIWKCVCFVIFVSNVAVIFTWGTGISGDGVLPYYLIGNKFSVSYYQMFFLSLFLIQNKNIKTERKRARFFVILFIYSVFICKMVDCNTGIVGCCIIGLIFILTYRKKMICKILANPITYLVFFCGLSFLIVGTDWLFNLSVVQDLIVNVFHRNLTLTGRTRMYEVAMIAFGKKPIWGYGINSTYVEEVLSWGNAQNGLLKMLLDYGIMGTASFLLVCGRAFYGSNKESLKKTFSLMAFLYGMAVCAMVEINLSGLYFFGLALYKSVKNNIVSTEY